MSDTMRYYFGDPSDFDGLTRAEVIDLTDADTVDYADRHEELITEVYGTVSIGELTWDAGRVLRKLDPIAFRCGVSDETSEIDLNDYPSDDEEDEDEDDYDDEYVPVCPACGEFIDYCQGHGDIGDPDGADILKAHDNGIHDACHTAAVSSGQCD